VLIALCAVPLCASEIAYRDKLGRTVLIETPLRRAAMFQLYDFLPPLNAWGQVSCLAYYCRKDRVMMATNPAEVMRLSDGMGSAANLNIEKLIRLKPDLVVTWSSDSQQVDYIDRCGLKVISIFPESLNELYGLMDLMGQLFERKTAMAATKKQMQAAFALIHERVAPVPRSKRQRVLWLSTRPTTVIAGQGLNNELIRLIGGVNVAGAIQDRTAQVSLERIIKWNPDVVFILGRADYDAADLLRNPQWRTLRAVRSGRVYKLPNWISWSPMIAPTAMWMAVRAYPKQFSDIEINAWVDRFCRQVYGVGLKSIGGSCG